MAEQHERYPIDPYLWLMMVVTFLACVPGLYLVFADKHLYDPLAALIFGIAIFGAAFILSWAAEVAQMDISQSLAVAILALVAVLPEYAVDFVFTWKAAHDPTQAHYALANMTGANRLLVGLGWPAVVFLYIFAKRRKEVRLDETQRVEIFYLAMATVYSFTIPLKGSLNLIDTIILVTLFGLYTRRVAQMPTAEPEMVGPVKIVANASKVPRRLITALFFAFSGFVIFFVAEPFAHSLVQSGTHLGIDEFFLVQWLAPVASESPEFIVAATWALRGQAGAALKALISSKVNQWTLLVGTIPLVFAISAGEIRPFLLDVPYGEGPTKVQTHELILTAAQSFFAVGVLVNLVLSKLDSVLLLSLFLLQLVWQDVRMEVAVVYIVLAVIWHIVHRRDLIPAAKMGLGMGLRRRPG